jgi:hypothetical protein
MDFEKLEKAAEALDKVADRTASTVRRNSRVTGILVVIAALLSLSVASVYEFLGWIAATFMSGIAMAIFGFIVVRKLRSISVDLSKLKGAAPFGDGDKDRNFFASLRREDAMENLCRLVMSGDVAIVLVQGPWGVGKTSLVKAGLRRCLDNEQYKEVKVFHANARRGKVEEIILGQVKGSLPNGAYAPKNIEEVVAYRDNNAWIIVIDNADLEDYEKLKTWAELALAQPSLYRKVLVFVIDNVSLAQDWNWGAWSIPEAVGRVDVERFQRARAIEVARAVANEANLPISDSLITDMVDDLASKPGAEISPLALSVLLSRVGSRGRFSPQIYRDSGYALGLLKGYILDQLDKIAPEHSANILAALARQDVRSFTVSDLGGISMDSDKLSMLLVRISSSDVHILHASRDRSTFKALDDWIPTLRALGEAPIENRVVRKYDFWAAERPFKGFRYIGEGRFLLTRNELRQIEDTAAHLGSDIKLQTYISRSKSYRSVQFAGAIVCLLACIPAFILAHQAWRKHDSKTAENAWGLPKDLVRYGGQLSDLSIVCPVNDLRWFPRTLTALDAECNLITSLRGVPPQLKHLGLGLTKILSLSDVPSSVTDLNLYGAKILQVNLKREVLLESLDASGIPVLDMNLIPRSVARLKLQHPNITDVKGLPGNLTELVLRGTRVPSLKALPSTIIHLTLLQSAGMAIDVLPPRLEYLETNSYPRGLKIPPSLKTLILSETVGPVPEGIESLGLKNAGVAGPLPKSLKYLKCYGEASALPLDSIPQDLKGLKIVWPKGASLSLLPRHLAELDLENSPELSSLKGAMIGEVADLNIGLTEIKDLEDVPNSVTILRFEFCHAESLVKFPERLQKLYLGGCGKLQTIDKLPETLTDFSLEDTSVSSLPKLPESLKILDISNTNIHGRLPKLPSKLDELVLDVGQITSLKGLPKTVKKLRFRLHKDK